MGKSRAPNPAAETHEGIEPPNHTQVPNALFDELMPLMSESELKVTLAICRQTFGWHRKEDELSLSQLMKLTGLARQSVINGIEEGMVRGLIKRRPKGQSFAYRLKLVQNLDQSASPKSGPELVQNLDQSSTATSPNFRPKLVQILDTQKKGKKDHESSSDHGSPAVADDDETVSFLRSLNVACAEEFAHLPIGPVRERVKQIQRDPKWQPGAIVNSLRKSPPKLQPAPTASTPAAPPLPPKLGAEQARAALKDLTPTYGGKK